jgi:tetraacyldisaccharide 4'-kinase
MKTPGNRDLADSNYNAEAVLTRAWQSRGPLACLLWPLSLLFGALAALRRALFALGIRQAARLPAPVIVVGNVFVGGTGKTPFSIWLIEALRAAGYTPGVISRGYGGEQDVAEVNAGSAAARVGDEPLLIVQRTGVPLVVGRRRAQAGLALLAAHPEVDVVISDDGLQHYALARDIEIVLSDARGAGAISAWSTCRRPAPRRPRPTPCGSRPATPSSWRRPARAVRWRRWARAARASRRSPASATRGASSPRSPAPDWPSPSVPCRTTTTSPAILLPACPPMSS